MEEDIEEIHNKYYQINSFTEIDHVPSEFVSENFRIDEICLLINYDAFDKYYPSLIKIVTNKNTST